jgi:hypothetical protein
MQPSEETVEAVARAIADVATQRPVPWETRHPLTQDALRTDARICLAAVLAALPAVGLAVVGADDLRAIADRLDAYSRLIRAQGMGELAGGLGGLAARVRDLDGGPGGDGGGSPVYGRPRPKRTQARKSTPATMRTTNSQRGMVVLSDASTGIGDSFRRSPVSDR